MNISGISPQGSPDSQPQDSSAVIFTSSSEEQTQELGKALGVLLRPGDVVLLSGDLGAGKTQFTKGVGRALSVTEPITSPTFPILSLYNATAVREQSGAPETTDERMLAHFDLYRIEREDMLDDVGYWETLEGRGGEISLVEWGDKFPSALPADYLAVTFSIKGDCARTLSVSAYGPRSEELARRWAEFAK